MRRGASRISCFPRSRPRFEIVNVKRSNMARRKGNDIHGWLILDKPQGLTSNQALGRLKRLFNPKKVGHAGTLDPLATGRSADRLWRGHKDGRACGRLREELRFHHPLGHRDRHRRRGGPAGQDQRCAPHPRGHRGRATGVHRGIMQTPPCYSAIKVDGDAPTTSRAMARRSSSSRGRCRSSSLRSWKARRPI